MKTKQTRAKHTGWEGPFKADSKWGNALLLVTQCQVCRCFVFCDSVLSFVILSWVLRFCFGVLWLCFGFSVFFFSYRPPYSTISSLREELVRNFPKGLEWNRNCKNQRNLRLVLKPSCTNSINQILVFQIKPVCLIFLQHLSLIKGQELFSWRSKWLGVQYKLCEALNDITQLAAYN